MKKPIRLADCLECAKWFLGCLNGREKWEDKAKTPNLRYIGQSGKVYTPDELTAPEDEYPMRMICDDFEWDPDPNRHGRVVG